MPGFHVLAVMRATGAWKPQVRARAGSPWAVPLLVLPDGRTLIRDSHEIAKHAAAGTSLYPQPLRTAIDEDLLHFHDKVGPVSRRFAYYHLFAHLDAAGFAELAAKNGAPSWQVSLLSSEAVFAKVKQYIGGGLGVNRERAARAEAYIGAELDAVAARLARGGPHLHGAGATLADLSFASLMAPALGISTADFAAGGSPLFFPPPHALGAEYAEKAAAWREHEAGRFAVELIRSRNAVEALPSAE